MSENPQTLLLNYLVRNFCAFTAKHKRQQLSLQGDYNLRSSSLKRDRTAFVMFHSSDICYFCLYTNQLPKFFFHLHSLFFSIILDGFIRLATLIFNIKKENSLTIFFSVSETEYLLIIEKKNCRWLSFSLSFFFYPFAVFCASLLLEEC